MGCVYLFVGRRLEDGVVEFRGRVYSDEGLIALVVLDGRSEGRLVKLLVLGVGFKVRYLFRWFGFYFVS